MVLMKKGSIAAALFAASMCFGTTAFAQQETTPATESAQASGQFSKEELKTFLQANTNATKVEKEGREALVAAIEEESLTVDRFNELAKAHRQKKLKETAENPEEIAAFSNAAQAIVKLQPEVREKVQAAIEEQGMTMAQYKTILKAYEEDEDLQLEIRRIVHAAE
ncbi:DUF4168 domain-containing protein [Pontibacter sp. E15-1]|uniref:DUF4168 domain-containing protein n=1 Tax=Pontibacter sp. E15-1 TaxID=2919918 RepID=UPI001F501D99|nr:DUF4168 domain-containing protein [Pontibacter sp. E15-1]MCJ8167324.1 DUF4168 domain-containing protein [Pontibacter sp. E15-1]